MTSQFTPGTLVIIRKDAAKKLIGNKSFTAKSQAHQDFATKFKGKACVALVHENDGKGMVEITLASPVEQNHCNTCRSKLHINRTTGLRSCTQCNYGYGVKATKFRAHVSAADLHIPVTLTEQD